VGRVIVTIAGEPSREVSFKGDQARIGRGADCDVVIARDEVSRAHALITRERDGWTIEDLGSRNGTFVNEQRVERTTIRAGDTIRLGEHVRIEIPGTRPAAAAKPGAWVLIALGEDAALGRIQLKAGATLVGRESPADLVIGDLSVSRTHARLESDPAALVVTDLGSRNGTFRNGEAVERGELSPGDQVRFGRVTFEVARDAKPAGNPLGRLSSLFGPKKG
jgi:pSer/pThr/pTyr-binding forkhead associated (FHA) protein